MQAGHTFVEVMVVFSLVAALTGFASINMHDLEDAGHGSALQLSSLIKTTRAKAISKTSAYFLKPSSTAQILGYRGKSCADPSPQIDSQISLDLSDGVTMTDTGWQICFTPRGLVKNSVSVFLQDQYQREFEVQVFMGGTVRIQ